MDPQSQISTPVYIALNLFKTSVKVSAWNTVFLMGFFRFIHVRYCNM